MEEVVEEEMPTVQTAAGLQTRPSSLLLTPELLGPFLNIDFRAISFLSPPTRHIRDGSWQEGENTALEQKPVEL